MENDSPHHTRFHIVRLPKVERFTCSKKDIQQIFKQDVFDFVSIGGLGKKFEMALRLTPVEGLVTIQVWGAQRIRRTCGNFVNASLHGRLVLNIWCRVAGPMGLFVPSAGGSRPGSTPSATCSSVGRVGVRLRRWPAHSCTVLTCPSRSGSGLRIL